MGLNEKSSHRFISPRAGPEPSSVSFNRRRGPFIFKMCFPVKIRRTKTIGLGGLLFVLGFVLSAQACDTRRDLADPPFPKTVIREALDARPIDARQAIERHYPGSRALPGALGRIQVEGSDTLEEVILFTDVRSGRVNTVILKFKPGLSSRETGSVLEHASPGLRKKLEEEPVVVVQGPFSGTRLRARRSDKQGRLTLTVEPVDEAQ